MMTVVVAAVAALGVASHKFPDTPLFAGLGDAKTFEAGRVLLDSRIHQRYAVGSPEGDIAQYLRSQGMETKRLTNAGRDGKSIYGEARALAGPGVCDRVALVRWRADQSGKMTELNVTYSDTGCL